MRESKTRGGPGGAFADGRGVARSSPAAKLGGVMFGLILGAAGFLGGCADETRETGTRVEFDAEKQKEGQKRMQEYMQKKAKGEVPGIPKGPASPKGPGR